MFFAGSRFFFAGVIFLFPAFLIIVDERQGDACGPNKKLPDESPGVYCVNSFFVLPFEKYLAKHIENKHKKQNS